MKSNAVYLSKDHLNVLFMNAFLFLLFFVPACGNTNHALTNNNNDTNPNSHNKETSTDPNHVAADRKGPTLILSYSKKKPAKNPIDSFMYFVPLISPTYVDNISSADNEQRVGVISRKMKSDSNSFRVTCEFQVLGSGFHMNTFGPAGMIAANTDELEKGETLTNMLDYIRIDGEGFGIIETKGRITDSARTVTEIAIRFNAKGHKSPVTIGLYDVEPEDGEYKYENRSKEIVARVNKLTFKKTDQTPKMGITIASVSKKNESAGFFGWIKGAIANMIIKPLKITELGNNTMLEFGEAILQKKPTFTFPKADNIKQSKKVPPTKKQ